MHVQQLNLDLAIIPTQKDHMEINVVTKDQMPTALTQTFEMVPHAPGSALSVQGHFIMQMPQINIDNAHVFRRHLSVPLSMVLTDFSCFSPKRTWSMTFQSDLLQSFMAPLLFQNMNVLIESVSAPAQKKLLKNWLSMLPVLQMKTQQALLFLLIKALPWSLFQAYTTMNFSTRTWWWRYQVIWSKKKLYVSQARRKPQLLSPLKTREVQESQYRKGDTSTWSSHIQSTANPRFHRAQPHQSLLTSSNCRFKRLHSSVSTSSGLSIPLMQEWGTKYCGTLPEKVSVDKLNADQKDDQDTSRKSAAWGFLIN